MRSEYLYGPQVSVQEWGAICGINPRFSELDYMPPAGDSWWNGVTHLPPFFSQMELA